MPVTKTAKRALRGSRSKATVNKLTMSKLEAAIRSARKSKTVEKILKATSLADRAAKRKVIHKNKAARIKSQLSKFMPKTAAKVTKKKASSGKK
jgi:small subunit ribosomal protein S20